MKILIRSDSSSIIGHGHVMRDLVLAKQLVHKHEIIFAAIDLPGNINEKIQDYGFSLHILASHSTDELMKVIHFLSIDMVVFDHYGINELFEKEVKEKTDVTILSLDDTYEKHFCDILLNHNPGAEEKKYSDIVPESSVKLCGARFTLIRDEFKELLKDRVYKVRDDKNTNILVMMGGSDPTNTTYKIALELSKNRNYKLSLVTTTSNMHLNMLLRLAKIHKNISLHINSTNIAQLMNDVDLAIISPSVTSAEAMYMNLPFIAIQTSNNQLVIFNYLKQKRLYVMKEYNGNKLSLMILKTMKNYKYIIRRLKTFHFSNVNLETYFM